VACREIGHMDGGAESAQSWRLTYRRESEPDEPVTPLEE